MPTPSKTILKKPALKTPAKPAVKSIAKPALKSPAKSAPAPARSDTVKKMLTGSRTALTGKNATPPAEAPVRHDDAPDRQQLAKIQDSGNGVSGELNNSDITVPSLKIVQAIGPLSENFEGGLLVLNGEIPITDAPDASNPTPIEMTVIQVKKQYEENLEYGDENRPRIFDTEREVLEAGGHCNWVNSIKPPFSPVAVMLVCIKAPETEDETVLSNFPYAFETRNKDAKSLEGRYALALYKTKGASFTRAAKMVFTAATMSDLKVKGLPFGSWAIGARREKINGNLVYVPVLKRTGTHPQEFVDFVRTMA